MPEDENRYDISNSTGVQAGNHNLQVNVTNQRKRGWFVTITVLVIVVLAVSVVGVVMILNGSDRRPELELAAFAVQKPTKVSGQLVDIGGSQAGAIKSDEVDTTAIDITLKNNGDAPAVLTGLELTVRYAEQLEDCRQQGGEVAVTAEYVVSLPAEVPATPFPLDKDIRFEVRGGVTDRFTITVGPNLQTVSSHRPWLIVTDVALRQDNGGLIQVGTAAVVTQAGEGLDNLSVAPVDAVDCIGANLSRIEEVFETPATRAEEFTELKSRYARLVRARTQPAKEACARPSDDKPIFKLCAKRDTSKFEVEMGLYDVPEVGASATLHIRSRDGLVGYTYEWTFDAGWHTSRDSYQVMYLGASGPGAKSQSVLFTGTPSVDVLITEEFEVEVEWSSGTSAKMPLPTASVVLR